MRCICKTVSYHVSLSKLTGSLLTLNAHIYVTKVYKSAKNNLHSTAFILPPYPDYQLHIPPLQLLNSKGISDILLKMF